MLLVIAIVRDEADNLLEWVAHHRAVGVDHFIVLDNDSTDHTPEILAALDAGGVLTHLPWPTRDRYPGTFADERIGPQAPGYERALEIARASGRWRWVGFLDLDEFVVPAEGGQLEPVLERFADAGAVGINWRNFGSSGLDERGPGLLTAQLTRRAPDAWPPNHHVKGFALLDAIRAPGIHLPRLKDGFRLVDTDGCAIDPEANGLHDRVAGAAPWINHYYTKTAADFARKRRRGRASKHPSDPERSRETEDYALHDRNEVEDLTIARFRDDTLAEVRRLLAIVEAAGVEGHGRRLLEPAAPSRSVGPAPSDAFDGAAYLLANPDVAEAGVDPWMHYLMHGRREGRRLRPD